MSAPSLAVAELKSVLRFPLWWYGEGMVAVARWFIEELRREWGRFGIRLWIKSWLQPMYGMSDALSRVISVVMRTVFIVGQTLWWCLRACVYLLGFLAWLLWLPLAVIAMLSPLIVFYAA